MERNYVVVTLCITTNVPVSLLQKLVSFLWLVSSDIARRWRDSVTIASSE